MLLNPIKSSKSYFLDDWAGSLLGCNLLSLLDSTILFLANYFKLPPRSQINGKIIFFETGQYWTFLNSILCPLITRTFSWGQKRCAYFGKCYYFGCANYEWDSKYFETMESSLNFFKFYMKKCGYFTRPYRGKISNFQISN